MKRVYLVALIVALMVGGATYFFARGLVENSTITDAPTTKVLVAMADVEAGTMITNEMIETTLVWKNVLTEDLAPEAVTNAEMIIGQVAAQDLYAGEQVSMKRIVQQGGDETGLSYSLLPGEVAYSIVAENQRGVDGYIVPGDTIDVIAGDSVEVAEGETDEGLQAKLALVEAAVVFENLEVLKVATFEAVSDAKNEETGEGEVKKYTSVTLRIKEDIAIDLFELECAGGDFKFILNSRVDAEEAKKAWAENIAPAN